MTAEEVDILKVMLGISVADSPHNSDGKETQLKYEEEWRDLCQLADAGTKSLKQHAVSRGLCGSRFRSIAWQVLLGSLPSSPALWVPVLRQQRNTYRLLRQRLAVDPRKTPPDDNPLSQNSASTWHQYFCDKELRAMIRQDVIRTFPNVEFFRTESIHCTMINVLFCYAREHPEMCYRQGMHEVLAPLLFVMHFDHQCLLRAQEMASVSSQAIEILDPTCLEEDAYWLFCSVMSNLLSNYRYRDATPMLTGHFQSPKVTINKNESSPAAGEAEVALHLKWIRDRLLSHHDPELYQHIMSLDIPFQTFGIRWLRVLFGQEFPLADLLYLWDAIFAEGDNFSLVDYIVVSMLVAIRDQLLGEDDTECLMLLMRYPGGVNVQKVVQLALHMRKPQKYPYPSPAQSYGGKIVVHADLRKGPNTNSLSGRFKKLTSWSQRRDPPPAAQHPLQAGPQTSNSGVGASNGTTQRAQRGDGSGVIIEGFTLNDPAVARAELQHSHKMLSYVHSQLEQHYATLEQSIPPNSPPAAFAALAGIKDLCVQLRCSLPVAPRVVEVEAASEAEPAPMPTSTVTRNPANGMSVDAKSRGVVSNVMFCPLKEYTSATAVERTHDLPLEDPLRQLYFVRGDEDWILHTVYRRALGTHPQ